MLLAANNSDAVLVSFDYPEWVNEWLNNSTSVKSEEVSSEEKEVIQHEREVAKQKNRNKRLHQMEVGLEDMEIWLTDTIRQGLASTERQGFDFWHDISSRMVDAKLGGLGKKIEAMQLFQGGNINWVDKMLSQMTNLYLVAKGFKNLEKLPTLLQQELLSVAGINIKKDEVLEQDGMLDEWMVMGQTEGVEDRLNFRRVWLKGQKTKKDALILDYVFGEGGFPNHFPTGSIINGVLCFYPSSYPLRAIVRLPFGIVTESQPFNGFSGFKSFTLAYSKALLANPWLLDFPVCFENVKPIKKKNKLFILDKNNQQLEVLIQNQDDWKLLAMSGGYPIKIFGEWTGDVFIPLSAESEGRLVAF